MIDIIHGIFHLYSDLHHHYIAHIYINILQAKVFIHVFAAGPVQPQAQEFVGLSNTCTIITGIALCHNIDIIIENLFQPYRSYFSKLQQSVAVT